MGRLLGEAGFTLMTGGYSGVMAAVSRGACEAGAKVIGVTLARFEERPNRYVAEEIRTTTFYDRFRWLIDRPDSFVAMDGGIGTLTEVTFAWQALYVGMIPARPLVLVGPRWRRIVATFRANSINPDRVFDSLSIVANPEQALEVLTAHFGTIPRSSHTA
jgi:uncharacterized protein (TIGR00730 family)